ncbi:hypothetical protein FHW16_004659 [Phyllobacterium myrsinacearum]|uniref:Uncharacterized protein n=1 Tax=Phyllobacterium myrsinacearum TaxID=28101 RepID=A0A839ETU0_9HYPH|nr:hypothetical protein [Phyllobacterium myrsinacearum]
MQNFHKGLFIAVTLLAGGILASFLFLYFTGHDPDERPLTVTEWVIGGILIGPGFGYLVRWRKLKDD